MSFSVWWFWSVFTHSLSIIFYDASFGLGRITGMETWAWVTTICQVTKASAYIYMYASPLYKITSVYTAYWPQSECTGAGQGHTPHIRAGVLEGRVGVQVHRYTRVVFELR